MAAAYEPDALVAAVAGTVVFGVAAERAAAREEVRGPGSFVPAFLDELFALRTETARGDAAWLAMAKVAVVDVEEQSE
ncbi:hypothetical protein E4U41_003762 [Claviceps citrina]|nr:hypothetical protein E4U41_003762 [Claviceps citrina]